MPENLHYLIRNYFLRTVYSVPGKLDSQLSSKTEKRASHNRFRHDMANENRTETWTEFRFGKTHFETSEQLRAETHFV